MEETEKDHQDQESDTQLPDLLAEHSNNDTGEDMGLFDEDLSIYPDEEEQLEKNTFFDNLEPPEPRPRRPRRPRHHPRRVERAGGAAEAHRAQGAQPAVIVVLPVIWGASERAPGVSAGT